MFLYLFKKAISFGILKYKMKKKLLTFLLSFFTFIAAYNAYADDKVYNVYMICWNGFDKSAEGFRDYLVSKDVKFNLIVRNLKENTENINQLKSEIKEKNPDIIITWGTAVTLGIFGPFNDNNTSGQFIRNIPGVFMAISDPKAVGIISNTNKNRSYLTGVTMNNSIEENLKNAKMIIDFKRLGILFDSNNIIANETINKLKNLAPIMDIQIIEKQEEENETIARQVKILAEKNIDSIYLDQASMTDQDRQRVIREALKRNIPVISNNISDIKSGALIATVSGNYNIGLLAGLQAYQILINKKEPAKIPISPPAGNIIAVNPQIVKKMGIKIPIETISKIQFMQ